MTTINVSACYAVKIFKYNPQFFFQTEGGGCPGPGSAFDKELTIIKENICKHKHDLYEKYVPEIYMFLQCITAMFQRISTQVLIFFQEINKSLFK